MVINKRWNIGESEYLLTQNLNQNKIKVHINSKLYYDKEPDTLFRAYDYIFEDLGAFRISNIDGIIYIIIDDSPWECEIDFFEYQLTVRDRNDGELLHSGKYINLYECFDTFLSMLEE